MAKTKEVVTPTKLKSFKSSELMESFYRYVHENGLREEAAALLKYAVTNHHAPRSGRKKKGKILQ